MADEVDLSVAIADRQLQRQIAAARVPIAVGEAGECNDCGRRMPRLVGGRCGFCRDGRRG